MSNFWQEILSRPLEVYRRLEPGQKLLVRVVLGVAVLAALAGALMASKTSWALLYAGMDPEEAAKIVAELDQSGIPYRIGQGGTSIEVDQEDVLHVRLQLAGVGLPTSGGVGFEIFDDNQLGLTDALFSVNKQRAIAGELQRTIETMDAVQRARVIVNLPKSSPFVGREREVPTAGINLTLRPGFHLMESNYAAMAHLTASCVGHAMKPENVTITDSELRQLYPTEEPEDPLFSSGYMQKVERLERNLEEKAQRMLTESLGPGKVSVAVSVALRTTYEETQRESREPSNKVVTRETTSTTSTAEGGAQGDPSTAALPSSSPGGVLEQTEETVTDSIAGVTRGLSIDKGGSIERLSVAVLLNGSDETLASAEQQASIETLVKAAVGFQEERGDAFSLGILPFAAPDVMGADSGGFQITDYLPLFGYLAETVTVVIVLWVLTRTLRRGKKTPVREAPESEAPQEPLDVRTRVSQFIQTQPEEAREALLVWLREEASV